MPATIVVQGNIVTIGGWRLDLITSQDPPTQERARAALSADEDMMEGPWTEDPNPDATLAKWLAARLGGSVRTIEREPPIDPSRDY